MDTTDIRKKVAEYINVGFTMSEAFENIKEAVRTSGRKTRVIDRIAEIQEKNGTYNYGFSGKEYGNLKWGNQ